jgi:hypothetical protein
MKKKHNLKTLKKTEKNYREILKKKFIFGESGSEDASIVREFTLLQTEVI